MNKKIKIITLLIIGFLISLLSNNVYAASASISAGKTTLEPGESTAITLSVSQAEAWALNVNTTGGTLSGNRGFSDAMGGEVSQTIGSLTFSAQEEGTYTVSATGQITGSDLVKKPTSISVVITVKAPVTPPIEQPSNNGEKPSNNNNGGTTTKPNNNTTTNKPQETKKSSNSRLSSLRIAEGILTPEFDSKTSEYTINVPNETTKLSIEAITDDSKASAKITGNDELQVGENTIEITVTAEDGSTSTYTIKAVRADAQLGLQSLNIFYIDENGEKIQIDLNPAYEAGLFEYTLKELSHKINNLIIEAVATRENAKIEITGHENLKTGENIITIRVIDNIPEEETETTEEGVEAEQPQLEEKIYTIKVNKEAEPVVAPLTTMQKIKNWFNGAGIWFSDNFSKIQTVALIVTTTLFVGLTVYYAKDYKNYKKLVEQLAEINKTNLMEKANFALNGEEKIGDSSIENAEEIVKTVEQEIEEKNETTSENTLLDKFLRSNEEGRTKSEKGRRFKK